MNFIRVQVLPVWFACYFLTLIDDHAALDLIQLITKNKYFLVKSAQFHANKSWPMFVSKQVSIFSILWITYLIRILFDSHSNKVVSLYKLFEITSFSVQIFPLHWPILNYLFFRSSCMYQSLYNFWQIMSQCFYFSEDSRPLII